GESEGVRFGGHANSDTSVTPGLARGPLATSMVEIGLGDRYPARKSMKSTAPSCQTALHNGLRIKSGVTQEMWWILVVWGKENPGPSLNRGLIHSIISTNYRMFFTNTRSLIHTCHTSN